MAPALQIDRLHKRFGETVALDGIDLAPPWGQVLAWHDHERRGDLHHHGAAGGVDRIQPQTAADHGLKGRPDIALRPMGV
ncbi:hypothetical protein [Halomonas sp. BC04]|uniref:hypothetical protein n=1 Tax=Halomonas sp. BC04 TaxID=1403540 RepID=UPI0003ED7EDF|nr:hypothetical protein [Halomonas sp. BC04]EWH01794.1 hypothetical protein Q427_12080 [Halomonas sp. BC04]